MVAVICDDIATCEQHTDLRLIYGRTEMTYFTVSTISFHAAHMENVLVSQTPSYFVTQNMTNCVGYKRKLTEMAISSFKSYKKKKDKYYI